MRMQSIGGNVNLLLSKCCEPATYFGHPSWRVGDALRRIYYRDIKICAQIQNILYFYPGFDVFVIYIVRKTPP